MATLHSHSQEMREEEMEDLLQYDPGEQREGETQGKRQGKMLKQRQNSLTNLTNDSFEFQDFYEDYVNKTFDDLVFSQLVLLQDKKYTNSKCFQNMKLNVRELVTNRFQVEQSLHEMNTTEYICYYKTFEKIISKPAAKKLANNCNTPFPAFVEELLSICREEALAFGVHVHEERCFDHLARARQIVSKSKEPNRSQTQCVCPAAMSSREKLLPKRFTTFSSNTSSSTTLRGEEEPESPNFRWEKRLEESPNDCLLRFQNCPNICLKRFQDCPNICLKKFEECPNDCLKSFEHCPNDCFLRFQESPNLCIKRYQEFSKVHKTNFSETHDDTSISENICHVKHHSTPPKRNFNLTGDSNLAEAIEDRRTDRGEQKSGHSMLTDVENNLPSKNMRSVDSFAEKNALISEIKSAKDSLWSLINPEEMLEPSFQNLKLEENVAAKTLGVIPLKEQLQFLIENKSMNAPPPSTVSRKVTNPEPSRRNEDCLNELVRESSAFSYPAEGDILSHLNSKISQHSVEKDPDFQPDIPRDSLSNLWAPDMSNNEAKDCSAPVTIPTQVLHKQSIKYNKVVFHVWKYQPLLMT